MVAIKCIADVCLIPIGTASPSVSKYVTKVESVIRKSPLKSTLHSAGTTIEGPWTEVMDLIGSLHEVLHKEDGVLRIQSDIRVGTRTDKPQTAEDKVRVVEEGLKKLS
ncbi:Ecm15 protein [Saccharomycopsis crataegensis]|uniref:Ecm15 protein n=1 Tax=Saccharomycopsis crataegensis TaxID=43959 RepID=A0AAV5QFW7_9ASCO|nr:Ecm15 protein [Saccharomycopsis crataegensis]